jgi:SAM-dependent methyltransferase
MRMAGSIEPAGLVEYYRSRDESLRLGRGEGLLEFERTQHLIRQVIPPASRVVDVGGGDGVHARWLMADGHDVVTLDLVPGHVERARGSGLSAQVGDARSLPFSDSSFDVALLLGPLYHLRGAGDRRMALNEAKRVLRSGGLFVGAAINRAAVLVDAIRKGSIDDPGVRSVLERIALIGHDDTGTGSGAMYFHRSEDFLAEVVDAGFTDVRLRGVEGPAWSLIPPDSTADDAIVEQARLVAELTDEIDGGAASSSHVLAFGTSD